MNGPFRYLNRPTAAMLAAALWLAMTPADARAAGLILTTPPSGGIVPVAGDPIYQFSFLAYLESGFSVQQFDRVTVFDVPGVDPTSLTGQPATPPDTGWTPLITPTGTGPWPGILQQPTVTFSRVDFTYTLTGPGGAPIVNATAAPLLLGMFTIQTYGDFPTIREPLVLNYRTTANGGTAVTEGTLTLFVGVPEPNSFIILGIGMGAPMVLAIRRRRRAAA